MHKHILAICPKGGTKLNVYAETDVIEKDRMLGAASSELGEVTEVFVNNLRVVMRTLKGGVIILKGGGGHH